MPQSVIDAAPPPADLVGEELKAKLASIDVDALTPREALELLYELAQRARSGSR